MNLSLARLAVRVLASDNKATVYFTDFQLAKYLLVAVQKYYYYEKSIWQDIFWANKKILNDKFIAY